MSLSAKTKNFLSFILRVGLSCGLLYYVFSKIDLQKTGEALKNADMGYIVLAAAIFMMVNGILLFRWFILIRALDLSADFNNVVRHFFYGAFGNLFLPTAIGGDIIKAVGLCKGSGQKARVVASILLDRISGFASITIVAVVAFIFGYPLINDQTLVLPIFLMGVVTVLIGAVLLNERIYAFCCRIFDRLPRLKNALMTMHYDIALLKEGDKYKEGIKAVLVSCCSQTIFVLTYYFTAKALHQDIALIHFLVFVPIICVISALPSIGGLGVREVGAVYLFTKIGIDSGIAVSLTLINFLFMVMIGLMGGIIYVYSISFGRIQSFASDESAGLSGP